MSTPRIAISQGPYIRDVEAATNRALDQMRHAASRGADIVVFPEWFLGLNPVEVLPNRYIDKIGRLARELNVMVISGSVRALEPESGKKQQRCVVIERDGTMAGSQAKVLFQPTERPWFEPGPGVGAISTRWGRIVILAGLDAMDDDLWRSTLELAPDLVIMAASPRTLAERSQFHEETIVRSQKISATTVLAPLLGRFSGSSYIGGALIAHQGRVLAVADEQETMLISGDPEAPLIQLGVTDVSTYVPVCRPLDGRPLDVKRALGPEAERRVLIDWGVLTSARPYDDALGILSMARDNPRWIALAPFRPGHASALRQLLEQGAGGAFGYPGLDRVFPWSDEIRTLGQIMEPLKRPLIVHSGPGAAPLRFDSPGLWDEFLMEFPSIPVIIHSMGQCSPYLEEALVLAERHAQVLLETSHAPLGAIKEAIRALGPTRLVFGSGGLPQDFHDAWGKIQRLESDLSPEAYQKIIHLNAYHLFFEPSLTASRPTATIHPFQKPG